MSSCEWRGTSRYPRPGTIQVQSSHLHSRFHILEVSPSLLWTNEQRRAFGQLASRYGAESNTIHEAGELYRTYVSGETRALNIDSRFARPDRVTVTL